VKKVQVRIMRIRGDKLSPSYFLITPVNVDREDVDDLVVSDCDYNEALRAFTEGAEEKFGEIEIEILPGRKGGRRESRKK
jgi:hypothetical protein